MMKGVMYAVERIGFHMPPELLWLGKPSRKPVITINYVTFSLLGIYWLCIIYSNLLQYTGLPTFQQTTAAVPLVAV